MPSTTIAPASERARAHRARTRKPLVHAFPENSLVALCGKTRKQTGNVTAAASDRCPVCLDAAGRKQFVSR